MYIYISIAYKNYILLTYIAFLWIKMLKEISSKNNINIEESRLLSKYPHVIKLFLIVIMIITAVLSIKSFISFLIFTIVTSDYYSLKKTLKIKEGQI